MNASDAASIARSFGSAIRPGLVLGAFLIGGVAIGQYYDKPIIGMAAGFTGAAVVNGLLAWNDARSGAV